MIFFSPDLNHEHSAIKIRPPFGCERNLPNKGSISKKVYPTVNPKRLQYDIHESMYHLSVLSNHTTNT